MACRLETPAHRGEAHSGHPPGRRKPVTDAARLHSLALSLLLLVGCASVRSGTELYSMPSDPAKALSRRMLIRRVRASWRGRPLSARPRAVRGPRLRRGGTSVSARERRGGPQERARAAPCLPAPRRAGDRELYIEAVGAWEREASRGEKAAGELSVHVAIRDRLCGRMARSARVPRDLRRLLPPLEVGG